MSLSLETIRRMHGYDFVDKFGHNGALNTSTFEEIWSPSIAATYGYAG